MIKQEAFLNQEQSGTQIIFTFSVKLEVNTHSSVVEITLIPFLLISLLIYETGYDIKASLDVFFHIFFSYTHSQKDKGFVKS